MGEMKKKRAIGLGAAVSAGLLVGLLAVLSSAPGRAQEAPPPQEPSPYERTKDLVGERLAEALGLRPLQVDPDAQLRPGEGVLAGCPPVSPGSIVEVAEGVVYCTAGITSDPFEAWDIAERLRGHVPTECERAAYRLELMADALYDAGDAEGAEVLWAQAQESCQAG